jgi:hypothetical protein
MQVGVREAVMPGGGGKRSMLAGPKLIAPWGSPVHTELRASTGGSQRGDRRSHLDCASAASSRPSTGRAACNEVRRSTSCCSAFEKPGVDRTSLATSGSRRTSARPGSGPRGSEPTSGRQRWIWARSWRREASGRTKGETIPGWVSAVRGGNARFRSRDPSMICPPADGGVSAASTRSPLRSNRRDVDEIVQESGWILHGNGPRLCRHGFCRRGGWG